MKPPSRFELESQLFALVKTFSDLQEKVKSGAFSFNFYYTSLKKKMKELFLIELVFKKKNMDLGDILDEMEISKEFLHIIKEIKAYLLLKNVELKKQNKSIDKTTDKIIHLEKKTEIEEDSDILSKLIDLNLEYPQSVDFISLNDIKVDPIELAKISADITSDFITIIDLLKLKLQNLPLLKELTKNLKENLNNFPGMDELSIDISITLKNKIMKKENSILEENDFDELFTNFESYYIQFKKNILIQLK